MTARFEWDAGALDRIVVQGGRDVLEQVSAEILADAKRGVPVDTGDLRDSLERTVDPSGKFAQVGSDLAYAAPVELGTSKTHPQPYLRPALYRKRGV